MIKKIKLIIIIFSFGCNALLEESTPLKGDFYIQDGWLAFSSSEYEEATKHFNTAIETNGEGSGFHFLSFIGKGWTQFYQAKSKNDSINVQIELIELSGVYFSKALGILSELDSNLYNENERIDLFVGLSLQRTYSAKQKSVNMILWETNNIELSNKINQLYEEAISYSLEVNESYVFKYDSDISFENIVLLRIENYILIGDFESAVSDYKKYGFDCVGNEINIDTIVECLCITINDGICPFNGD